MSRTISQNMTEEEANEAGIQKLADYVRTRLKPLEQSSGAEVACRQYADHLTQLAQTQFGAGAIPIRWETVARWAAGQAMPEGQHLAVLAADLRQPVGYLTLLAYYEREQNPEAKRYMLDVLADRSFLEGAGTWRSYQPEQIVEALAKRLGESKLRVVTRHLMVRYLGHIADLLLRTE